MCGVAPPSHGLIVKSYFVTLIVCEGSQTLIGRQSKSFCTARVSCSSQMRVSLLHLSVDGVRKNFINISHHRIFIVKRDCPGLSHVTLKVFQQLRTLRNRKPPVRQIRDKRFSSFGDVPVSCINYIFNVGYPLVIDISLIPGQDSFGTLSQVIITLREGIELRLKLVTKSHKVVKLPLLATLAVVTVHDGGLLKEVLPLHILVGQGTDSVTSFHFPVLKLLSELTSKGLLVVPRVRSSLRALLLDIAQLSVGVQLTELFGHLITTVVILILSIPSNCVSC